MASGARPLWSVRLGDGAVLHRSELGAEFEVAEVCETDAGRASRQRRAPEVCDIEVGTAIQIVVPQKSHVVLGLNSMA